MHACLHYDNASSHRSELVKQYLNSEKIIVLPYSVIHYTLQTLKWSYLFVLTSPNKLLTVPSFGTLIQSKYVFIVLHINYEKFFNTITCIQYLQYIYHKNDVLRVFWGGRGTFLNIENLISLSNQLKKKRSLYIGIQLRSQKFYNHMIIESKDRLRHNFIILCPEFLVPLPFA